MRGTEMSQMHMLTVVGLLAVALFFFGLRYLTREIARDSDNYSRFLAWAIVVACGLFGMLTCIEHALFTYCVH